LKRQRIITGEGKAMKIKIDTKKLSKAEAAAKEIEYAHEVNEMLLDEQHRVNVCLRIVEVYLPEKSDCYDQGGVMELFGMSVDFLTQYVKAGLDEKRTKTTEES
jgi:hypothetical protein